MGVSASRSCWDRFRHHASYRTCRHTRRAHDFSRLLLVDHRGTLAGASLRRSLLSGIVGIVAGLFVLRHPLLAALTVPTLLIIILGVQGLILGVLEIIGAFKGGGIGSFILGIINLLVGLVLLSSPVLTAFAFPIVFGVLLLVEGVGLTIWAFRVRGSRLIERAASGS